MKQIILLIALLITNSASAESFQLPFEAICDDTKIIVGKLIEVNEIPIATGQTSDVAGTMMVLWLNTKTKAWTITATKENTTCVIGTGEQLRLVKPKTSV